MDLILRFTFALLAPLRGKSWFGNFERLPTGELPYFPGIVKLAVARQSQGTARENYCFLTAAATFSAAR